MKRIFLSLLLIIFILNVIGNTVLATELDIENTNSDNEKSENVDELGASTDTSNENEFLTESDFASAKYEIKYSSGSAVLTISGVKNMNTKNTTFLCLGVTFSANEEPKNIEEILTCNAENGTIQYSYFAKYVELNQDIYVHLFYVDLSKKIVKKVVTGQKVERPPYPKYADAFNRNTLASSQTVQLIIDSVPKWAGDRKGNIKIGKISDSNILNNIKNNMEEGWKSLLSYSKSDSSPVYNSTQECSKAYSWILFEDKLNISTSQLSDKEYYYLYIEMDDENGKYYPIEAVTLTQASVYQSQNAWYMFFVGNSQFNWNNIRSGNTTPQPSTPTPTPAQNPPAQPNDPTVAPTSLPRTGADVAIIVSIVGLTIAGGIAFIKSKKYKGIN